MGKMCLTKRGIIVIDEKKVSIMTKISIYEKHESKKAIAKSRYYKSDYVRFNVLKTWVAVTVGFWAIVGSYVYMYFDDILTKINETDYFDVMYKLLGRYVLVCALYFLFASLVYTLKYELERPGLARYNANLKDLIELEGGPMHHAKMVADSDIDNSIETKAEIKSEKEKQNQSSKSTEAGGQHADMRRKVNRADILRAQEEQLQKDREAQIIENVRLRNERIAAQSEAKIRQQQRYEEDRRAIMEKRRQLEQEQMEKLRAESMQRMNRQNHIYDSDTERREN